MEDIKNKIQIDINDIAMAVYGFLMKKQLLTPDEYHILRCQRIVDKNLEEDNADGK